MMADTYADPFFLSFNSSLKILEVLRKYLDFDIDLEELKKESEKIEKAVKEGINMIKELMEKQKLQKDVKTNITKYYYG